MKRGRQGESCRSCEYCRGILYHFMYGVYPDCKYDKEYKVNKVDLSLCGYYKPAKKGEMK